MARTAYSVLLVTVMGCGADWSSSGTQPLTTSAPPVLIRIAVFPHTTTVALGSQALLYATAYYSDGSAGAASVTWTSDDTRFATVTSDGLVHGVAIGSTTIWARSTRDSSQIDACQVSVIEAAQPPVIVTAALPNGTVGSAYSATLAYDSGSGAPEWSVVSGALPPGLLLDPTTGTISGNCVSAGTFTFTAQVADDAGVDAQELSITVVTSGGGGGGGGGGPRIIPAE